MAAKLLLSKSAVDVISDGAVSARLLCAIGSSSQRKVPFVSVREKRRICSGMNQGKNI
jgi:hypothetical protein